MGGSSFAGSGSLIQDLWWLALVLILVLGMALLIAASWYANRRH